MVHAKTGPRTAQHTLYSAPDVKLKPPKPALTKGSVMGCAKLKAPWSHFWSFSTNLSQISLILRSYWQFDTDSTSPKHSASGRKAAILGGLRQPLDR